MKKHYQIPDCEAQELFLSNAVLVESPSGTPGDPIEELDPLLF